MAGEAKRRGTFAERKVKHRGVGWKAKAAVIPERARRALRQAAGMDNFKKREARIPKRERAKLKRAIKKQFGYTRRDVSRIGAGHREATDAYVDALIDTGI